MQDTISKNTGNSRTLASVPNFLTLYPTYEAFAQALIDRTLPIDLGPLNPAGLVKKGDDLNKANLLKDTTAALYGKTAAAVPDEIFTAIRPLIQTAQNTANAKGKFETGTYIGTGTTGADHPNSLSFSFPPVVLFFIGSVAVLNSAIKPDGTLGATKSAANFSSGGNLFMIDMADLSQEFLQTGPGADAGNAYSMVCHWVKKSSDGRTLTWYSETRSPDYPYPLTPSSANNKPGNQFNQAGYTYRYAAIG